MPPPALPPKRSPQTTRPPENPMSRRQGTTDARQLIFGQAGPGPDVLEAHASISASGQTVASPTLRPTRSESPRRAAAAPPPGPPSPTIQTAPYSVPRTVPHSPAPHPLPLQAHLLPASMPSHPSNGASPTVQTFDPSRPAPASASDSAPAPDNHRAASPRAWLLHAIWTKPTLSKTWERRWFAEERRGALGPGSDPSLEPGTRSGIGLDVDVDVEAGQSRTRETAARRPTSFYASPAAMLAHRGLPLVDARRQEASASASDVGV